MLSESRRKVGMLGRFSERTQKKVEKMGSKLNERKSFSRESVFSEEAGCSSGSSVPSSSANSATSSRESSFDEFRSDSCNSDYCDDDLESDNHGALVSVLEAGPQTQAISSQNDLLFQTLQCRWLILRDQLRQMGKLLAD